MQTAYYIGHNAGRVSMEYITYGMDGVVIRTGGGSSRAVMPDPRTPPPRRKYAGPPGPANKTQQEAVQRIFIERFL